MIEPEICDSRVCDFRRHGIREVCVYVTSGGIRWWNMTTMAGLWAESQMSPHLLGAQAINSCLLELSNESFHS